MELKNLKPKFGRWLTIEELRDFLAETPDEVFQQVPINRRLLEIASEFVEKQKGWWEHPDWEGFLVRLSKDGFHLSQEVEPPIGNILEIFKDYYQSGQVSGDRGDTTQASSPEDGPFPEDPITE